jgi:mannose-1-phosphate guanylyltransferase / phosphomannomutase
MILAAGKGTRLGFLGRTIPKALLPVGDRPLLERHLEYLAREGFTRVVVNAHHLAPQVEAFVASYRGPLHVCCMVEQSLLGTAGSIRNALPQLGRDSFLVLYGDVLVDEPLGAMIEFHRQEGALATLAVYESSLTEGKGVVRVDSSGRVTSFEEKNHIQPGPALVNAGLYFVNPPLLASLPRGEAADFGDDVFPRALERGWPIAAYTMVAPVIDIGTPEGLARARAAVCEAV